jgi:hypothetical protein
VVVIYLCETDNMAVAYSYIERLERIKHAPRWLSLKSASEYSSISQDMLRELCQSGRITWSMVNPDSHSRRAIRVIDRLSIDTYLESRADPF